MPRSATFYNIFCVSQNKHRNVYMSYFGGPAGLKLLRVFPWRRADLCEQVSRREQTQTAGTFAVSPRVGHQRCLQTHTFQVKHGYKH